MPQIYCSGSADIPLIWPVLMPEAVTDTMYEAVTNSIMIPATSRQKQA